MGSLPDISPLRLCDAAEACMQVWDNRLAEGKPLVLPCGLKGTLEEPELLRQFTRYELSEGTSFLIRLGYLPATLT